jgi:hypothetical protein
MVWISERAITSPEHDLRAIVFHEIVHAVWGIGHIEKCPLMRATTIERRLSKEEAGALLVKYAKKGAKS